MIFFYKMYRIFFLVLPANALLTLLQVSQVICNCDQCNITPFLLNTNQTVVAYGNASSNTFDWMGVNRDFLPRPVIMNSYMYTLNCSSSIAFLINGSTIINQYTWEQTTPLSCTVPIPVLTNGDFAFVAALMDLNPPPTRVVTFSHPQLNVTNAVGTSGGDAVIIRNQIALDVNPQTSPDCALPNSFLFCGTNFTQTACGLYNGICIDNDVTPPLGCNNDPLFSYNAVPPIPTWLATLIGKLIICLIAALSVCFSVCLGYVFGALKQHHH